MSRRKRKPATPAIEVETRSVEERLVAACRYLEQVDQAVLDRLVTAAEAFVSVYQQRYGELEPEGVFQARIARISGRVGESN